MSATFAPSSAKARTMARPTPLEAPVTTAVFPSSLRLGIVSLRTRPDSSLLPAPANENGRDANRAPVRARAGFADRGARSRARHPIAPTTAEPARTTPATIRPATQPGSTSANPKAAVTNSKVSSGEGGRAGYGERSDGRHGGASVVPDFLAGKLDLSHGQMLELLHRRRNQSRRRGLMRKFGLRLACGRTSADSSCSCPSSIS